MRHVLEILLIIFVTLKLVGALDWSWFFVLAPLWGPLAFFAIIFLVGAIFMIVRVATLSISQRQNVWRAKFSALQKKTK